MTEPVSLQDRASGLLLHPTSLPGPHGNGDLGPAAHAFVDYLVAAGQRWWQVLPVGPTGAGNSPYQSFSTFAGNPALISLEKLAEQGLLAPEDLAWDGPPPSVRADFKSSSEFRKHRLRKAFDAFEKKKRGQEHARFIAFCEQEGWWLNDYALFCMLKVSHELKGWLDWPAELSGRDPAALDRELKKHGKEARYYQFQQYQFFRQWQELKADADAKGVGLIGDIPIFVAHDSADVWTNRQLFFLDDDGRQTVEAGVPPDYFSAEGQRWGNPLYRWDVLRQRGYDWWIARLRMMFRHFDAVRIDHFIGFHRYWEIPVAAASAKDGVFKPGPGAHFFQTALQALGPVQIVAEDLGLITEEVKQLRDTFEFPGMRVLQFSFGPDEGAEEYRPHNYPRRCLVYTGTHDNDTTMGWFRAGGPEAEPGVRAERELARRYLDSDGREFHWDMIRMALMSNGNTAVIPVQDLLGLGAEARMNLPGDAGAGWSWRLTDGQLTPELAARLQDLSTLYGRKPPQPAASGQP